MKKRNIYKSDVGKIFRVYTDPPFVNSFEQFELVCSVHDSEYVYYSFRDERGWVVKQNGKTSYLSYYFEEVNALTALILFGNNIPKEFRGFEYDN
jgi:subtilase family serine protease